MPVPQTMKIAPDVVDALRRLALDVSASLGRRVSLSETLGAAVAAARRDMPAVLADLAVSTDDEPSARPARTRKGGRQQ